MKESETQISALPFELIEQYFSFLPMHTLLKTCKQVNQIWRKVAKGIIKKQIKGCYRLLNNIGSIKPSENIPNFFDINELGLRGSKSRLETESPFKSWLLCNLEYPSDSNVISGIEIELSSYDEDAGELIFTPTGSATFGMWVEHVGFFPITAPYSLPVIAWLPNVKPLFRIWTHVDEKMYPDAHLILNQPNSTSSLPKNKKDAAISAGDFVLSLYDDIGKVGRVQYTILQGAKDDGLESIHQHSNLPPSLSGENLMLMHLEKEEHKIASSITAVYINPQVLFAMPL